MKKLKVILDTDVYNEIDDQFAIAYLLANDAFFEIQSITIAPYSVPHQNISIKEGIDLSYSEAKKILKIMKKDVPVYKGASDFIQNDNKKLNDAVNNIIKICRRSDMTTIIGVGAITNIALAIYFAPDIINRIKVIWLGTGHIVEKQFNDTNFKADPEALKIVLDSNVDFTIVSTSISKCMRMSVHEMEAKFVNSPLKEYLIERTKWFYYYESNGQSITLHDVVPIDLLINSNDYCIERIARPNLINNGFKFNRSNKFQIRYVTHINQYKSMNNFIESINKFVSDFKL